MSRFVFFSSILAASMAIVATASAQGEVTAGPVGFRAACAACHGEKGVGDGPLATQINPMPADLTILKQANGGVFPFAQVLKTIDGREPMAAHGSAMPVWGDRFKWETIEVDPYGAEINALGRIAAIVYYLDLIQK